MDKTEQLLLDTLSLTGPNIIKSDWVITEVVTPEHEDDGTLPPINKPGNVTMSEVSEATVLFFSFFTILTCTQFPGWSPEDQTVTISELKQLLDELGGLTQTLLDSLKDAAVPVNGELHLNDYQNLLGGVDVTNHADFDSLFVSVLNGEPAPSLLKDIVR